MPKLRDIQEQFARHLGGLPTNPNIVDQVRFNQLENQQRLQVYKNNFRLSLTNSLAAVYPVIEKLVGKQFFNYACHEFINSYPSRHGNLHQYGNEFADFLSEFDPARSLPYLADMARFEWAYHEVFHEASAGRFDTQALQQVPEQQYSNLVFYLHPASRLLASRYPLTRIWQANQADNPEKISLQECDNFFLVGRRNNENVFQTLEKIDFDFLSLVSAEFCLEEITDRLRSNNGDSEVDLNALLISHVTTGNICKFKVNSEPL